MKEKKRVYTFGAGKAEGRADMRNELGGKGANLAEMNLIGVPVPPGFTITTDTCNDYYKIGKEQVVELLRNDVEKRISGRRIADGFQVWRCDESLTAFRPLRRTRLNARNDGHYPKPRTQ